MVKLTAVWPAAKVTDGGTVASPVSLLESATVSACVVSPSARVRVAVVAPVPVIVVAPSASDSIGPTLPVIIRSGIAWARAIGGPRSGLAAYAVPIVVIVLLVGRIWSMTPSGMVTDAAPAGITAEDGR